MRVTIRLSTEVSYSVTIPDNSSVEDLRNSAKVACPPTTKLPNDFKLIYNGVKLAPYQKQLVDFRVNETDSPTVILMSNGSDTPNLSPAPSANAVATTSTKKKSKKRCSFQSCSSAPLRLVGDCAHCQGKFCAKHRLLEDHLCLGLQSCKDNAHERNALKLQSEKTIVSRV